VESSLIRIVIADDQDIVRVGLKLLVNNTDGMIVVGEASTGREALLAVSHHQPDVLLLDLHMPDGDGLSVLRELSSREDSRAIGILVLSTFGTDEYVIESLRLGAIGYVLKDSPPEVLLSAIVEVSQDRPLLSSEVTRTLMNNVALLNGSPRISADLSVLTARETEVLQMIARGTNNTLIGETLSISRATVKTHVGSLLRKLDASDRSQLVIAAYEYGLVTRRSTPGQ